MAILPERLLLSSLENTMSTIGVIKDRTDGTWVFSSGSFFILSNRNTSRTCMSRLDNHDCKS